MITKTVWAVALCAAGLGAWAQSPAKDAGAVRAPTPAQELLEQGKYTEALAAADLAVQKDGTDVADQVVRIDALMGMERYLEATRLAIPLAGQHPERPDLRYRIGQCAERLGMFPQALQTWSALYACPDKEWAGRAYVSSARLLTVQGRDLEARALVAGALARWAEPPLSLLRFSLETDPNVGDGLKHADLAAALDPKNKPEYEALKQIFAAAGEGELFQEPPASEARLVIKLREKSETRSLPSLYWGAMDSGTGEMTTSSRVVVPVALNGTKERWMLLDSGSDVVLLARSVVEALGLKTVSTTSYVGIGYEGVEKSAWVLIKSLSVGDFSVRNVPAMVIDENADFWKETGGIIPLSLFSRHGVVYDRRGGKVTLLPPGTKPEVAMEPGSFSVRSLWYGGKPYVSVKVQDKSGLGFLVDTGAYTTFIARQYADEIGVRVNYAAETKGSLGLSGTANSGQAPDVTLWLGPARFHMSPCQVMGVYQEHGAKTYGIIGRNVLDQFKIYFDYRSNVIAFKAYDR